MAILPQISSVALRRRSVPVHVLVDLFELSLKFIRFAQLLPSFETFAVLVCDTIIGENVRVSLEIIAHF